MSEQDVGTDVSLLFNFSIKAGQSRSTHEPHQMIDIDQEDDHTTLSKATASVGMATKDEKILPTPRRSLRHREKIKGRPPSSLNPLNSQLPNTKGGDDDNKEGDEQSKSESDSDNSKSDTDSWASEESGSDADHSEGQNDGIKRQKRNKKRLKGSTARFGAARDPFGYVRYGYERYDPETRKVRVKRYKEKRARNAPPHKYICRQRFAASRKRINGRFVTKEIEKTLKESKRKYPKKQLKRSSKSKRKKDSLHVHGSHSHSSRPTHRGVVVNSVHGQSSSVILPALLPLAIPPAFSSSSNTSRVLSPPIAIPLPEHPVLRSMTLPELGTSYHHSQHLQSSPSHLQNPNLPAQTYSTLQVPVMAPTTPIGASQQQMVCLPTTNCSTMSMSFPQKSQLGFSHIRTPTSHFQSTSLPMPASTTANFAGNTFHISAPLTNFPSPSHNLAVSVYVNTTPHQCSSPASYVLPTQEPHHLPPAFPHVMYQHPQIHNYSQTSQLRAQSMEYPPYMSMAGSTNSHTMGPMVMPPHQQSKGISTRYASPSKHQNLQPTKDASLVLPLRNPPFLPLPYPVNFERHETPSHTKGAISSSHTMANVEDLQIKNNVPMVKLEMEESMKVDVVPLKISCHGKGGTGGTGVEKAHAESQNEDLNNLSSDSSSDQQDTLSGSKQTREPSNKPPQGPHPDSQQTTQQQATQQSTAQPAVTQLATAPIAATQQEIHPAVRQPAQQLAFDQSAFAQSAFAQSAFAQSSGDLYVESNYRQHQQAQRSRPNQKAPRSQQQQVVPIRKPFDSYFVPQSAAIIARNSKRWVPQTTQLSSNVVQKKAVPQTKDIGRGEAVTEVKAVGGATATAIESEMTNLLKKEGVTASGVTGEMISTNGGIAGGDVMTKCKTIDMDMHFGDECKYNPALLTSTIRPPSHHCSTELADGGAQAAIRVVADGVAVFRPLGHHHRHSSPYPPGILMRKDEKIEDVARDEQQHNISVASPRSTPHKASKPENAKSDNKHVLSEAETAKSADNKAIIESDSKKYSNYAYNLERGSVRNKMDKPSVATLRTSSQTQEVPDSTTYPDMPGPDVYIIGGHTPIKNFVRNPMIVALDSPILLHDIRKVNEVPSTPRNIAPQPASVLDIPISPQQNTGPGDNKNKESGNLDRHLQMLGDIRARWRHQSSPGNHLRSSINRLRSSEENEESGRNHLKRTRNRVGFWKGPLCAPADISYLHSSSDSMSHLLKKPSRNRHDLYQSFPGSQIESINQALIDDGMYESHELNDQIINFPQNKMRMDAQKRKSKKRKSRASITKHGETTEPDGNERNDRPKPKRLRIVIPMKLREKEADNTAFSIVSPSSSVNTLPPGTDCKRKSKLNFDGRSTFTPHIIFAEKSRVPHKMIEIKG